MTRNLIRFALAASLVFPLSGCIAVGINKNGICTVGPTSMAPNCYTKKEAD